MNYNIFHIPNLSSLLKRKQELQNKTNEDQVAEPIQSMISSARTSAPKDSRGRKPKICFEEFKKLYQFYWSVGNSFSFEDGQSPSVKDFCRQYGVPERTYFHYKKQIA